MNTQKVAKAKGKRDEKVTNMKMASNAVYVVDKGISVSSFVLVAVLIAGGFRLGQAIALEVNPLPIASARTTIRKLSSKVL